VRNLLGHLDAEDEEEYYYYPRKHEEYHDNLAKFKELPTQLEEEHFQYDSRNELSRCLLADPKEEEENISIQIEEFNKKIQHEQKVLAGINSEIAALESDGKLSELNHMFEMRKNQIQGLSHE